MSGRVLVGIKSVTLILAGLAYADSCLPMRTSEWIARTVTGCATFEDGSNALLTTPRAESGRSIDISWISPPASAIQLRGRLAWNTWEIR